MKPATNRTDFFLRKHLNPQYERIRNPQSNDPPLLTPADASEDYITRGHVLSMPVYVIEQDGRPLEACRTLTEARERACYWVGTTYSGRAPRGAADAFDRVGSVTRAGVTTRMRATTIGALLDALPAHAEHFAKLDRPDVWW